MSRSVSHERAAHIRRLFGAAADLVPADRAPYLQRHCSDDTLRREVEALLSAFDHRAGSVRELLESISSAGTSSSEPTSPNVTIVPNVSRYEIQERLGAGGMGVVYKALDTKLDRTVALKFLPTHLSLDLEAKTRLIREARAASSLDHPNICTVYDVDESEDGRLFIAMAYCTGKTLKATIARGPLPADEALEYAIQMTGALENAHEAGIVHRDIKPTNVMVTGERHVRLLDFGIAKARGVSLTRMGTMLGTAYYMSPEQARGVAVDQRTDLWSLGVILYEMLVGKRPFEAESEQAVIYQVLHEGPAPLINADREVAPEVEEIVKKCLQKSRTDRYASAALLLEDLARAYGNVGAKSGASRRSSGGRGHAYTATSTVRRARFFIIHMPDEHPDGHVARTIAEALRQHHDVFVSGSGEAGARGVEQIQRELERSDFLIVLLSARSIHSEMVLAQIETARRIGGKRGGRPSIVPVRLNDTPPLSYPLSEYLDDLEWVYWADETDTPRLIEQLSRAASEGSLRTTSYASPSAYKKKDMRALSEPPAAAHPELETPEGTMDPNSALYVQRPQDEIARRAILQQGITLTIKGPRQIGKSSLLARAMNAAARSGKLVVFLDFQLFNQSALDDADTFFRQFCTWLTVKLKLENRVDEYWNWPLGNSQCCTLYVEDCVLGELSQPLVLAMDEVERVFDTGFRTDFFGMLRSWHNDRATAAPWKKLDLALVTSTEPYQLIENLNQSPFNVGEIVELKDFTPSQVAELNDKHGTPLSGSELSELTALVGGHPYLTRRALYLIAGNQIAMPDLLGSATHDRGPFGDHMRYHLFRLHGQDELISGLREVIRHGQCDNDEVFWRLQGAGLVTRIDHSIVPRCELYARYFRDHFDL